MCDNVALTHLSFLIIMCDDFFPPWWVAALNPTLTQKEEILEDVNPLFHNTELIV